MSDDEEQLRSKVVALGLDAVPIEPARSLRPSKAVVVALAASLIWAVCFAAVIGWNVGHAPFNAMVGATVYSDPYIAWLFPVGEAVYAASTLIRAWLGVFLGEEVADLGASTVVGLVALPIGFFHAAVICAALFGVVRIGRVTSRPRRA